MSRAFVRVVVGDDVPLVNVVAELPQHTFDSLGHRAHKHRGRVRLGKLIAAGVKQARAEVLRLSNDRRVRHPKQDARYLLRDRLEGPADDSHQHRHGHSATAARSGDYQSVLT